MKQVKCIKAERLYHPHNDAAILPDSGPSVLSPREKRLRDRLRTIAATTFVPESGKVRVQVEWLIRREPPLFLVGSLVHNVYSGDEDVTFQYMTL